MTNDPRPYRRDRSSRNWIILLIFLVLASLAGAAIWAWMSQDRQDPSYVTASSNEPAILDPLPPPVSLDKPVITDAEAVADGTLSRFDGGRWLESESFIGTDEAGRRATMRIYILNETYSWEFESGNQLTGINGSADLSTVLTGDGLLERVCRADNLLAIGTSSFEGPQALNHRLARSRGRALVSGLVETISDCTLNTPQLIAASLGEHAETSPCPGRLRCPEATSSQRRIILIGVESLSGTSEDINFDEALWSGLRLFSAEQEAFFQDFRLTDYDRFELLD